MRTNSDNEKLEKTQNSQESNNPQEVENDESQQQQEDIPVLVSIDNSQYLVTNWNLEEFEVEGFEQELPLGDCLPILFSLPSDDGIHISIETLVELKNRTEGSSIFTFLNITSAEKEILEKAVNKFETNQLVPKELEDIKKEVDGNIENVYSEDSRERKLELRKLFGKRKVKLLAASVVGLSLGGAILYYAFSQLHEAVTHMTIKSAVVTRPVEPIVATDRGTIHQVYVDEGTEVQEGEPLLQIYDREMAKSTIEGRIQNLTRQINEKKETLVELNRDLQFSNLDLSEARLALENAKTLRDQELNELEMSQAIAQRNLTKAQAQVESLQAQATAEQTKLNRYSSLLAEGAITEQRVDSIRANLAKIQGDLKAGQAELAIAQTAVNSARTGQVYDGEKFVSDLPQLTANIKDTSKDVQLSVEKTRVLQQEQAQQNLGLEQLLQEKQKLETTLANIDNLSNKNAFFETYTSPATGSILEVSKPIGGRINRGETLVLLQPEIAQTTVEAYLTQDQSAQLELNQPIEVVIPELETTYVGTVVEIDRTGGFPKEIAGKYAFNGSQDKPAYVKVELTNIPKDEQQQLAAGTPVRLRTTKQVDILNRLRFTDW